MELKAFEPSAVVVAVPPFAAERGKESAACAPSEVRAAADVVAFVPPFAIGMTPVRENVVVVLPPEVETVEVMFPVPMSWKLIAPEVPLKVETKAVEDERYCVEAVYAAVPKPREEEEKVREAEVVVVETEMKGFVDVTL